MSISFIWETDGRSAETEELLRRVADACLALEGIENAGFCVTVTDHERIRALNHRMRGIDQVTDVLSFPTVRFRPGTTAGDDPDRIRREYDPALGCCNLGDCVIDLERAREQAAAYGHSLRRELGYLTAHSAFHLMGYDHMDPAEARIMRGREKEVMRRLGLWRDAEGEHMSVGIDHDDLFKKACLALENAYAPYSHFRVGACILTEDGRTYSGCNFENASLGATICAERCAASCAIADGQRRFAAIAIAGESQPAWPCGICRQVLREFSPLTMPVIVGAVGGSYRVLTLGELLPESFGPEDLLEGGEA